VTTLQILALCLGSLVVSYALTAWIRAFALRKGIVDVPNPRSSHVVATPRGGGLAFVIVFLAVILDFLFVFPSHQRLWIA